ncbi:membrane transporter [Amylocarpus encephaloides]|uniref:Membrane transporter n=1 Tax=Amylocarpus encephaloides TaxID=45428 RepID=A0A9P8C2A3_9HELO|nr:membrane transporter [Amylocarpus encephaloides]
MQCTPGFQAPRKAKPTDLQGRHEIDQDTRILMMALRWKSRRHFLFFAIAVSTIALTALSRSPKGLFCQPIFQPWRSHLFASLTLKDGFPLSTLETILHSEPSAFRAADWSYYYTSQSHFPGEGKAQGLWTQKKWEDFGIPETEIVKYNAPISTPIFQRLALLDTSVTLSPSVIYEAKLMEELPFNDPSEIRTPAFHGQSSSGNVTAQFVYANFGRDQDYDDLEQNHVEVKGKIAIVKYGIVYRGTKMSTAAERGLVGILIYTDPQQDGNITEGHGFKEYPDGPARPETCIERGSIGTIRNASEGNPGVPGQSIPSLPVSYSDIVPLLKALDGHGPKAADMRSDWHGGGLYYRGVEYYAGPSASHIVLNLNNQMSFPTKEVHQIFGIIRGSIEDEVIILGNHRDSWGAGAGDSISGAAALMEVVRSFAMAYRKGWRPRRTIVFVSWEGAETGQVGSQPWIESLLPWLQKAAVAYLNVVVAAGGRHFQVKATPLLQEVIHRATKAVSSPEGGTVFDHWGGEMIAAGGGDAIPFLETACVSTSDLSFGALYWPYHSNFDTFTWMNTSGDPGWKYHVTTAKIWSLITAYLSESPVLQIKAADYAVAMQKYVERIKEFIPSSAYFDLGPIEDAIAEFHNSSIILDGYASSLRSTETDETIRHVNQKYIKLERQFCYEGAHLVYDFSAFYSDPVEFPRLSHSLESEDLEGAREWMEIIQAKIRDAANLVKL